jgi:hypothetical protein
MQGACPSPVELQNRYEMKSQSMHYQGRRSRRGRRKQSGRGVAATQVSSPKPKPTLWQRIQAFFQGQRVVPAKTAPVTVAEKPIPKTAPRERVSRKPELIEVTSPKLYVGNLSFNATESDLFELFRGVGEVRNAEIVSHKYTQRSKGFAFVQMTTIEEARRAVEELHDKEFLGRKLVVSGAKTPDMERAA